MLPMTAAAAAAAAHWAKASGERLTVSDDCLPMLTKMAPRNVMPSLFMYAPPKLEGSTVSTVYSLPSGE